MHKLATAIAVGFAALTANAALALACEEKTHLAEEQTQQKPAVAKSSKQTKQQQKAKKADPSGKTAVARADKG